MSDVVAALAGLASDTTAPTKARKRAAALRQRLTSPIRIGVGGPQSAMVAKLMETLMQTVTEAHISDQVADADIAVWCTDNFGPDEVAFWDAAPANLQDHSLLVGPDEPYVQGMGATYFAQHCGADAVSDILSRKLQQGRQADADQAAALLARHPSTHVANAPIPDQPMPKSVADVIPQPDLVVYLQKQADALAQLQVTDTPESCEAVLAHCSETAMHLSELVTALPEKALQDAVFDAVDAITLMTLEGDMAAACDAVAVLIELKTQLESPVRQIETIAVP